MGKDVVFRSMAEYLEWCKPKPPAVTGDKYYRMGVEIARKAIEKVEREQAGIAQW